MMRNTHPNRGKGVQASDETRETIADLVRLTNAERVGEVLGVSGQTVTRLTAGLGVRQSVLARVLVELEKLEKRDAE